MVDSIPPPTHPQSFTNRSQGALSPSTDTYHFTPPQVFATPEITVRHRPESAFDFVGIRTEEGTRDGIGAGRAAVDDAERRGCVENMDPAHAMS